MRRLPAALIVLTSSATLVAALALPAQARGGDRHDEAEDAGTSFRVELAPSAVDGPPIGTARPGSLPWVIDEGEVEFEDGVLRAEIEGLIVPTTGVNPVAALSIGVLCAGEAEVATSTVAFSPAGDAVVEQALAVPAGCSMPQVLVHPGGNVARYIAFG